MDSIQPNIIALLQICTYFYFRFLSYVDDVTMLPTPSPPLIDSLRGVPRLAFSQGGLKMPEKGGHRSDVGILPAHLLVVKKWGLVK